MTAGFVDDVLTRPEITGNTDGSALREASISDEAIGMVMSMLSDAYSRPEEAVVRELVCNGIDAQLLNGSDLPIRVDVPTRTSPQLVVADHGVGMTAEQLLANFADYGSSTKAGDRLSIGRFGIGAKSPYAVTNQFTVVTTCAGITTTALFTLTSDGIPAHRIVSSRPAADPSRTSTVVTVPVDPDRSYVWHEAARRVAYSLDEGTAEFFDHPPHAPQELRNPMPMPRLADRLAELGRTELAAVLSEPRNGHPHVVMGQVGYQLPYSMHQNYPDALVFFMPPSSLELTHTREHIKDTPHNRAALDEAAAQWRKRTLGEFDERWAAAPTLLDRRLLLDGLDESLRRLTGKREEGPWSRNGIGIVEYHPDEARNPRQLNLNVASWLLSPRPTDQPLAVLDVGPGSAVGDPTLLRRVTAAVKVAREEEPELVVVLVGMADLAEQIEHERLGRRTEHERLGRRTEHRTEHQGLPLLDPAHLTGLARPVQEFLEGHPTPRSAPRGGELKAFFAVGPDAAPLSVGRRLSRRARVDRKDADSYTEEQVASMLAATPSQTLVVCTTDDLAHLIDCNHGLLNPSQKHPVLQSVRMHFEDAVFVAHPRRSLPRLAQRIGAARVRTLREHVRDSARHGMDSADPVQRQAMSLRLQRSDAHGSNAQEHAIAENRLSKRTDALDPVTARRFEKQRTALKGALSYWDLQSLMSLAERTADDLPDAGPGFFEQYPLLLDLCSMGVNPSEQLVALACSADRAAQLRRAPQEGGRQGPGIHVEHPHPTTTTEGKP